VASASAFSWGELVRVNVVEASEAVTELQIATKRRLLTNVFAQSDWSAPIAASVRELLDE